MRRLSPGDLVDGRYEVLALLGEGGMGAVYRALDRPRAVEVALKVLRPDLSHALDVARFLREAEVLARVDRVGGIARVHSAGAHAGSPYFVMELAPGRDLGRVLGEGPMEPRRLARIVEALARTLAACHAAGIVHRDVKPANVLLGPDDRPRLLDFGLAKEVDRATRLTQTGEVLGTPSYLAPEQLGGDASIDGRADVYALGALLYRGLAGRPPFEGPVLQLLAAKTSRDPVAPSTLRGDVPPGLEAICLRALARDPAARHPGAAALADDLGRWLGGADDRPRPRGRKTLARALLVGAAVVLAAAAPVAWRARARRLEAERAGAERAGAERALQAVLEWDGWRCSGGSCGGAHALVAHALGLGRGPAPALADVDERLELLRRTAGALPPERRADLDAEVDRLAAWARRLAPAQRPAAPGSTGHLVEALLARDLGAAVARLARAAEGPAQAPEWARVRAELEVRAATAGPQEPAARALWGLPRGDLDAGDALEHARRLGDALSSDVVIAAWGKGLATWVGSGDRAPLPALQALRAASSPRLSGFVLGVRARLERAARLGDDDGLARALQLDSALRGAAPGAPRWELEADARERIAAFRGSAPARGSAALLLAGLALDEDVTSLRPGVVLRDLQALALDPEGSRALRFLQLEGRSGRDLAAAARAALEAQFDDLGPSHVASTHEQALRGLVDLLGAASPEQAEGLRRQGLPSAAALREHARHPEPGPAPRRIAEALYLESILRTIGRPAEAPAVVDDIEAFLARPPEGRTDWGLVTALARSRVAEGVSSCVQGAGPAAAPVYDLCVALATRALDSSELDPGNCWRTRAVRIRFLREGGRKADSEAFAREHLDPPAWGHWLYALEAALAIEPHDRARALELARAGLPLCESPAARQELERLVRELETARD